MPQIGIDEKIPPSYQCGALTISEGAWLMSRNDPQMKIRLPEEVKEWLETRAKKNVRSQNAEIVFILKNEMERQSLETSENEKTA